MATRHRTARITLMLVALTMVAAACGARVSQEQIRAAQGGTGLVSSAGAATGRAPGEGSSVEPGESSGGGAQAATVPVAGSPGSTGAASPGAATATVSGDNGGATDVGVTAHEVVLGSVVTLSGPVPGLFAGSVTGAQAVIAYQNSKGGLFGRKFRLDVRDDQFDTGQNRAETTDQLNKAFAVLGSFSLYDDAAVAEVRRSGIPDFSIPINKTRQEIPNNLSVAPIDMSGGPTGGFDWIQEKFPDAVKAAGTLYGDVPASKAQHVRMQRVAEALGWKFVYARGYQATETDFTADVIRMRQSGVKGIYLFAADDKTVARLAASLKQQGLKPDFVLASYLPAVPPLAGDAVEGWYGVATQSLFAEPEEAAVNPEIKLFQQWMQKVKPGVKPDLYAVYSWAFGRLLFQAMEMAGPKVTRAAVIDAVRKIGTFSGRDTVAPANPGAKTPAICFVMTQIKGGVYKRIDPAQGFDCRGKYLRS